MAASVIVEEVPGSWQAEGGVCYQLRSARNERKILACVRWPRDAFPRCGECESHSCPHVAAVRSWRKERHARVG